MTCKGSGTIGHTSTFRHPRRSTHIVYFLSILIFAFLTIGSTGRVFADHDPAHTDETQQVADDATPPVVSVQISDPDTRTVSGVVSLAMTVDEANPLEYSIYVFNSDNSEVIVDGSHVGDFQNPAVGTYFTYSWDTSRVTNGDYQIKFSASDQDGAVTPVTVMVTVLNQGAEPAYPPITPVLEPIPINQTINPTTPRKQSERSSQTMTDAKDNDMKPEKNDVLAARIDDALAAQQETVALPAQTCAIFFGTCWYWSVPATFAVGASSYVLYRYRRRSS